MALPFSRLERRQLARFCAYGFLKNQFFFEPFLILAFLEKGFSFAAIGILIGFRAISVNLLEIPSGALADVWGRRRTMVLSMMGYILSFVTFALATRYAFFFPAMFAFAIGEAFRTGTHKAMIFDWLTRQGHRQEKVRVYGLTRSWSKLGSVVSVCIGATLVIVTDSYRWVFLMSVLPYLLNIANLATYPAVLDGVPDRGIDRHQVWRTLRTALARCAGDRNLRTLIAENVCFEGYYSVAKEYLQPLLKAAALSAPILLTHSERHRTAILVATVYAALGLLSSLAARHSHRVADWAGGETPLSGRIWRWTVLLYVAAGLGMISGLAPVPILCFVVLGVLLNIWKPLFVSRFYDHTDEASAATTLSVANQSKTLSVAVLAPLVGWAVDWVARDAMPLPALWPVAATGLLFALLGGWIHCCVHDTKAYAGGEASK